MENIRKEMQTMMKELKEELTKDVNKPVLEVEDVKKEMRDAIKGIRDEITRPTEKMDLLALLRNEFKTQKETHEREWGLRLENQRRQIEEDRENQRKQIEEDRRADRKEWEKKLMMQQEVIMRGVANLMEQFNVNHRKTPDGNIKRNYTTSQENNEDICMEGNELEIETERKRLRLKAEQMRQKLEEFEKENVNPKEKNNMAPSTAVVTKKPT